MTVRCTRVPSRRMGAGGKNIRTFGRGWWLGASWSGAAECERAGSTFARSGALTYPEPDMCQPCNRGDAGLGRRIVGERRDGGEVS